MNKSLLKGLSMYSLGLSQELFGRVLGNSRLQVAGIHMQVGGKCQIAVGDAQRIIRHCLKQQEKPVHLEMKTSGTN
ncbi:MAG: CsbD family protein [Pseudomonadota bacterium]